MGLGVCRVSVAPWEEGVGGGGGRGRDPRLVPLVEAGAVVLQGGAQVPPPEQLLRPTPHPHHSHPSKP